MVDLLASYQIERHIRKERDERKNRLKKEVTLTAGFQALWDRIKPKTTYRVEFATEVLVQRAVDALRRMERIEKPRIRVIAGRLDVRRGGVETSAMSVAEEGRSLVAAQSRTCSPTSRTRRSSPALPWCGSSRNPAASASSSTTLSGLWTASPRS